MRGANAASDPRVCVRGACARQKSNTARFPPSPFSVLAALDNACDGRFGKVMDAARDVAPGMGESDLRRLKRQVS